MSFLMDFSREEMSKGLSVTGCSICSVQTLGIALEVTGDFSRQSLQRLPRALSDISPSFSNFDFFALLSFSMGLRPDPERLQPAHIGNYLPSGPLSGSDEIHKPLNIVT